MFFRLTQVQEGRKILVNSDAIQSVTRGTSGTIVALIKEAHYVQESLAYIEDVLAGGAGEEE